jgi:type IV pilus assembly protein PilO
LNELIYKILDQSRAIKIAMLAGTILVVFGLYYTFVHGPRGEEKARLLESVEVARKERQIKLGQAANLPRLQAELRAIEIKLNEAMAQLPERKEIPDLLTSLSNKAREAGLEIMLFRPRAENFQEFYAEIPVDIVVKGGFSNAVTFFDEVSKLNRIVNINHIDLKHSKASGERVSLDISNLATTYRFLDEAERKKVAEAKAKAKAAKK